MKRSKDSGNIDLESVVKEKMVSKIEFKNELKAYERIQRDRTFVWKLRDMVDEIEAASCPVVYTGAGISTVSQIVSYCIFKSIHRMLIFLIIEAKTASTPQNEKAPFILGSLFKLLSSILFLATITDSFTSPF